MCLYAILTSLNVCFDVLSIYPEGSQESNQHISWEKITNEWRKLAGLQNLFKIKRFQYRSLTKYLHNTLVVEQPPQHFLDQPMSIQRYIFDHFKNSEALH